MNYREDPKSGNKLSVLGYGCMRLPRGINAQVDANRSEKLILSAIEKGVNYFDTAYIYGGSEQALGEIFRRNPGARDKIFLATKLPYYQCKAYADFDRLFGVQLERLATDHIDYYLIHNMSNLAAWKQLVTLGIEKWIQEKKASGQIRQIGFSFHGKQNEFMDLIDAYDWEFCQIQYNYVNENYQAGRLGLQKAHSKGMAVIIMEPLLGGKLAVGLPKKSEELFKQAGGNYSPAAWALRWLWDQKEVTLLLSGMNSEDQINDNIKTASAAAPGMLSPKERETIKQAEAIFRESYKIPCTGCNYCMPCPNGVNIPGCFAAYNVRHASGLIAGMSSYITGTGINDSQKNSSGRKCIKCGKCERQCPQHIKIMQSLETVTKYMEPWWLRAGLRLFNRG